PGECVLRGGADLLDAAGGVLPPLGLVRVGLPVGYGVHELADEPVEGAGDVSGQVGDVEQAGQARVGGAVHWHAGEGAAGAGFAGGDVALPVGEPEEVGAGGEDAEAVHPVVRAGGNRGDRSVVALAHAVSPSLVGACAPVCGVETPSPFPLPTSPPFAPS